MKTLLLASDLSERSDRALDRAILLAADHAARLVVVHVIDDSVPDWLVERQKTAADEALRKHVLEKAASRRLDVSVRILDGDPYAEIIESAEEIDADLIILGMHRKNTLRDLFRGTTMDRVIRAGRQPVLIVHRRAVSPYRRIAVATDFSVCSRLAMKSGLMVAPTAEFHLIHAFDIPFGGFLDSPDTRSRLQKEKEDRMGAFLREELEQLQQEIGRAAAAEARVRRGPVIDVLRREIETLNADLLAMGTHGRTGIGLALLGSVTELMLVAPPTDILVTPAW